MSNLDNIVAININIAAPAVDSASFGHLMIIGPPPAVAPPRPLPAIGVYADLGEVADAGYSAFGPTADPVGVAARIAFSQSPRPAQIFISTVPEMSPTLTGGELSVITPANYLTTAVDAAPSVPEPNDLPWLQMAYARGDGIASMEIVIEKDGVVVFGSDTLPTFANPNAFEQVVIGAPLVAGADAMNIPSGDVPGTYKVTLAATDAAGRVSTITQALTLHETGQVTQGPGTSSVIPLPADIAASLNKANETPGWYAICPAGIDESLYETIAEWTETQIKLFAYTFLGAADPTQSIYYRSQGWCGLIQDDDLPADVPQANAYLHVAAVAKCLSYPAGSETWAFKRLVAVNPSQLSSTLVASLVEGHSNYFTRVAGRNITMNGQARGGEWIDVVRGRDWLQNDMQLRIFNLLIMNPKILFTNRGIALVQNEMIASLKAATERGIVAEDEYDADNELVPGFVVRVPNAADISASQKLSRVLSDCRFSARLAGAIHAVDVDGVLTY